MNINSGIADAPLDISHLLRARPAIFSMTANRIRRNFSLCLNYIEYKNKIIFVIIDM